MHATFRISEDDYVNAMRLFSKFTPRLRFMYAAVVALLVAIASFGSPRMKGGAIGGLAGGLFVTVVGRYIASPIATRRNYRQYKAIQDEFAVELLDEGLRFSSSAGSGKLAWNSILKWRQNNGYVLVYLSPKLYYILPKSIESGGFSMAVLTDRLRQHVGLPA